MSKPKFVYVLPVFANSINLKNRRTQFQDEYSAVFSKDEIQISLTETNSLIEDEYCLNLKSDVLINLQKKKPLQNPKVAFGFQGSADGLAWFRLGLCAVMIC